MKIEIKVKSQLKTDTALSGSYPYKGQTRIWYDRWSTKDFNTSNLRPGETIPRENSWFFTNRQTEWVISYDIDTKGKGVEMEDVMKIEFIEFFLKNHPQCSVNGKPHKNTVMPLFDITDKQTETVTKLSRWDTKRKIANYLAEADLVESRNVLYYYGHDPKNRTHGEICLFLSDFETGILFIQNDEGEDSSPHFIKTFIENTNPDKELLIHARKAVNQGLIEAKTVNGRAVYYHLGSACGDTMEDVVEYFKRNNKIYTDHILRKIVEGESFVDEKKMSEAEKVSLRDASGKGQIEADKFRDEVIELMKLLKSKGVDHGYSINNLRKMKADNLKRVFDELNALMPTAEVTT